MTRLALFLVVVGLYGCVGGALQSEQDCAAYTDTLSCQAVPGCSVTSCPDCQGHTTFSCRPTSRQAVCSAICTTTCTDVTDAVSCDARSDCYAIYSGELPCASSSCINHFVKCADAPTVCSKGGAVCNGSCALLTPSCPNGFTATFDTSGCCATGCVAATKCPMAASCNSDGQCGAGQYCRGELTVCKGDCQYTVGVPATGTCHRSCKTGACACREDGDCPGAFTTCDVQSGLCQTFAPPICHALGCPTGCTESTDTQHGSICVCASCN